MKKTFIAIFVGVAFLLMAGPSMALNGIDDNVPGTNPLTPFFLVEQAGFGVSYSGLDTLVVIQEVGGTQGGSYTAKKTKGYLHMVIRDKKSFERGDFTFPYTPNDVLAFSVRDLLLHYVGQLELPTLELTLNGIDFYTGYIDWENSLTTEDNLVSFIYIVDLERGKAAAATGVDKEYAGNAGYVANQQSTYNGVWGAQTLEPFSAYALAQSDYREYNNTTLSTTPAYFRFMPRFFLKDLNAETFIPIWSSSNHGTTMTNVVTNFYDNDENALSVPVDLPWELNWIDVRAELPTAGPWAEITGGWIHLPLHSSTCSWIGYSWQLANSPSADVNWSVLHKVHREYYSLVNGG